MLRRQASQNVMKYGLTHFLFPFLPVSKYKNSRPPKGAAASLLPRRSGHFLIEIQTVCLLPSCRVAISSQVPAENPELLVLRLKCQSVPVSRK